MYRVIEREGRSRVDTATKILGKTQFTNDVSLPGTLTAIVSTHPASAVRSPRSTIVAHWRSQGEGGHSHWTGAWPWLLKHSRMHNADSSQ
jgi:CO/xanthine dehydrogenase Mo-binding subunit